MPKRELKQSSIEIICTESQKATIISDAKRAGAKSTSNYVLTLLLKGDTNSYGFMRRRVEGPLMNAATYQKLAELVEALRPQATLAPSLMRETIELIREVQREIALNRFDHALEKLEAFTDES